MQIYQTDGLGLWDGNTAKFARPDPMTPGEYLISGGCVTIVPPALGANEAAQWLDGTWKVVPDFRGLTYWLADRSTHTVSDVGVTPPAGYLTADPGPTQAQLWYAYQAKAQAQLDANDAVAIRCIKAGVAYPADWLARDNSLRAIVRASSGDPTQPLPQPPKNADGSTNYPSGT